MQNYNELNLFYLFVAFLTQRVGPILHFGEMLFVIFVSKYLRRSQPIRVWIIVRKQCSGAGHHVFYGVQTKVVKELTETTWYIISWCDSTAPSHQLIESILTQLQNHPSIHSFTSHYLLPVCGIAHSSVNRFSHCRFHQLTISGVARRKSNRRLIFPALSFSPLPPSRSRAL